MSFDDVSPTALVIAWLRTVCDLPLAQAVAEGLDARAGAERVLAASGRPLDAHLLDAPFAEARYRTIRGRILSGGYGQVLELGAGFSFRGLDLAREHHLLYIDTDLAAVQDQKARLLEATPALGRIETLGRVLYAALDATDPEGMATVDALLHAEGPLAVVNEGLLAYLDLEEKAKVAANVRRVLEARGGAWFTVDLATHEDFERHHAAFPVGRDAVSAVARSTGRDFRTRSFEDGAHVVRFFRELGFEVVVHPQLDGSYALASLARLGLSEAPYLAASPRCWTLTLRRG